MYVSGGFCGVVVITSALHADGREFEPRQNLFLFYSNILVFIIGKDWIYLSGMIMTYHVVILVGYIIIHSIIVTYSLSCFIIDIRYIGLKDFENTFYYQI